MSPSGSRKMFPAWSRTHACYAAVAPAWFLTLWDNHQRTCLIGPEFQSAIASPQYRSAAHIAAHIQVSEWRGLGSRTEPAKSTCHLWPRSSTQPCKGEEDPFPGYCMYRLLGVVLWYMAQRSAWRGRGGPILSANPHRRARRFSAPYSKSLQGRGQSTSHCPRLPSLTPPIRCQPVLAACFRGRTTHHGCNVH